MTSAIEKRIQDFFDQYAAASLAGDATIVGAAYFKTYIEAEPSSIEAFTVDAAYKKAVTGKAEAMKKMGLTASEVAIISVKPIAPSHFLADAQWRLRFAREGKDDADAEFTISYVVRAADDDLRILLAISHEDEADALAELGLN